MFSMSIIRQRYDRPDPHHVKCESTMSTYSHSMPVSSRSSSSNKPSGVGPFSSIKCVVPSPTSAIAAAEAYTNNANGQPLPDRPQLVAVPAVTALPQAPSRKPFLNRLGFGDSRGQIDELTRRASELAQSFRSVSDTLTRNLERLANTPSIMPTTGWLSSHFSQSRLHPILHENRPHEGIDVSAPRNAPIIAPASGRVRAVGWVGGYGNSFEIDHGNGIVTRYAHCTRIIVREGQNVSRGQLIATVGNTGLSIGPHLHYEVHINGKPVDPLRYVLPKKLAEQH
ncbi:MAG: M23 family metallopeptidase [Gemmatimonadetes bacterium]|nr:M23 family metallopeptidase [Gemmatimonadota bacterium]